MALRGSSETVRNEDGRHRCGIREICHHKDPKVREVHTASITAGDAALSEVVRPNISVWTLNGPDGGTLSGKKLSTSRTIVMEIRRMPMAEGAPRRPRVVQQKLCV